MRLTVADVLTHADADGPISLLRADVAALPAAEVLRALDVPPGAHRALQGLARQIHQTTRRDRPAGEK
ncbi:hypothetical protein GCM10009785_35140 [Brooklawnia cerclae]|uniref:Uncharacterized protein n=1 Tax=Brooklawnia cerclae TaxID=349934 RepID=A0ABX0SAK1_9ACTN|nr:hypothetical protein [Brooklawnia cerclae]NIH55359.1 hypothetical protein [Brooklawnia cerclae]